MASPLPPPSPAHRARRPYPAVLIALTLGIGLSAFGAWAAYRWEKERVEHQLARATTTITESIEHCFYHQIDSFRCSTSNCRTSPGTRWASISPRARRRASPSRASAARGRWPSSRKSPRTMRAARGSRCCSIRSTGPARGPSFQALLEILGHRVVVAGDGPAALEAARSFRPEVAFIDIGLPGMDGYEVARRLRAQNAPPYLIAVTGYGQTRDRELAAMAGFDRHLVKPVDIAVLEEALAGVPARAPLQP